MVRQPRIQSPHRQRIAVTLFMALVFVGSVGLAALVSRADGNAALDAMRFQPVTFDGLRVAVPQPWQRMDTETDRLHETAQPTAAFRDPNAPGRLLHLGAATSDTPIPPTAAMHDILQSRRPDFQTQGRTAAGLQWTKAITIDDDRSGRGVRLRFLTVLTADGHRHWLILLTDRLARDGDLPGAVRENLALLRRIEQSATLEESFE